MASPKQYAKVRKYPQRSVLKRIEAFFLDNIGKVVPREMLQQVAKDPNTGKIPENWHQRLSDLRCLHGYTIRSWRNQGDLQIMEYRMPYSTRRPTAGQRVHLSKDAWQAVLQRSGSACEWNEAGTVCGLREGDTDPIGGGTVRLQADHKSPHSINAATDPDNPDAW
jgi:hypothetical protein